MTTKRLPLMGQFVRAFTENVLHVREVIVSLLALITLGGLLISYLEKVPVGEAIYFAFITGLSIGYGDITPETAWGRVISVAIGLIGMLFVGITVAIATRALADVARRASNDES